MAHVPTTESYLKKAIRIAKELDISIDKASITCDAFEQVFSDPLSRQAIFGMIEQLDDSAARKGEPAGLIINYGVEVGLEGIRVSRYADEIPSGEVVTLTPPDQACIFLQIKDDFPTQEVLGPMIVNRPSVSVPGAVATGDFSENRKSQIENPRSICLGPIRLKFEERFPLAVFQTQDRSFSRSADPTDPKSPGFLPRSAALQAGMLALQSASGLSPPPSIGECGHSVSKDVPWPRHFDESESFSLIFDNLVERTSG